MNGLCFLNLLLLGFVVPRFPTPYSLRGMMTPYSSPQISTDNNAAKNISATILNNLKKFEVEQQRLKTELGKSINAYNYLGSYVAKFIQSVNALARENKLTEIPPNTQNVLDLAPVLELLKSVLSSHTSAAIAEHHEEEKEALIRLSIGTKTKLAQCKNEANEYKELAQKYFQELAAIKQTSAKPVASPTHPTVKALEKDSK